MATLKTKKQEVFDYVYAMLGGGMVDVELDPVHYETALTKALTRFRQRSDNSVEESYFFMPTVTDQNTYTLPSQLALDQVVATAELCLNHLIWHTQIRIC
jgi:hypothetical protein